MARMTDTMREHIIEGMRKGSPRYLRARHFAHSILHLMRDFTPQDRDMQRHIEEYLLEAAFESNAAIINVPPECDALDNRALERHMLEASMQRAGVAVDLHKPTV